MHIRRPTLIAAALAGLTVGALLAQSPPARKARPSPLPTGLKILSTTLEASEQGRLVVVKVQNTTDKTIVGHVLTYRSFDKDGKPIGDAAGSGTDWAGPGDAHASKFIGPGQIGEIRDFGISDLETATVEASVLGLIYEDRTYEGKAAGMLFKTRADQGQKARQAAAGETGQRKTELENLAEWYEKHGPKEETHQ